MAYEEPEFAPAGNVDGIEFRRYSSYLVEETVVAGEKGWRVAFIAPRKQDESNVPQPTNSEVYIREVPETLMAVDNVPSITEGSGE